MIPLQPSTTYVQTSRGPIKAIHIKVPVGIPTPDGGLEIPNRVFLGGIPSETTELELETFFCDYGLVKDVRIVTDRITGESKGYGFVTFDEDEDISKLLKNQTIIMKGKKLRVRKAIRRNSSQFVNNDNTDCSASPDSTASSNSVGIAANSGVTEPVLLLHSPPSDPSIYASTPYPNFSSSPAAQQQPMVSSCYYPVLHPPSSSHHYVPQSAAAPPNQQPYPTPQPYTVYQGQQQINPAATSMQPNYHPAYFVPFTHCPTGFGYQMY